MRPARTSITSWRGSAEVEAEAHVSEGSRRTVIGIVGDRTRVQQLPWEAFSGVERAVPVLKPFKFVSRDFQSDDSIVEVGPAKIGGGYFAPIAGPCAVESRDQLFASAEAVKNAGATILRGDAFKPRTSPYAFQGLGEAGLILLAEAREEFGLPFVVEVLDPRDVDLVSSYADLIRVGTRNMANFSLLSELGTPTAAGHAEARIHGDDRGVAQRCRIHLQRGQPGRGPLRAGYPDVRDRDAQHARHLGGADRQGPLSSSDHRRSFPLRREASAGSSA